MKNKKLKIEKFQVNKLVNPEYVKGGNDTDDKTTHPTMQCRETSDVIIDQNNIND